jgi:hypothetical protein
MLVPSNEIVAKRAAENAAKFLEMFFTHAARPERGKRFKLPGVIDSFNRWLIDASDSFKIRGVIQRKNGPPEPGDMTDQSARIFLLSAEMVSPLFHTWNAQQTPQAMGEYVAAFVVELEKFRSNLLAENPAPTKLLKKIEKDLAEMRAAGKSFVPRAS